MDNKSANFSSQLRNPENEKFRIAANLHNQGKSARIIQAIAELGVATLNPDSSQIQQLINDAFSPADRDADPKRRGRLSTWLRQHGREIFRFLTTYLAIRNNLRIHPKTLTHLMRAVRAKTLLGEKRLGLVKVMSQPLTSEPSFDQVRHLHYQLMGALSLATSPLALVELFKHLYSPLLVDEHFPAGVANARERFRNELQSRRTPIVNLRDSPDLRAWQKAFNLSEAALGLLTIALTSRTTARRLGLSHWQSNETLSVAGLTILRAATSERLIYLRETHHDSRWLKASLGERLDLKQACLYDENGIL